MNKRNLWMLVFVFVFGFCSILSADDLADKIKAFNNALKAKNGDQIAQSIKDIASVNNKKAVQFLLRVALASENWSEAGLTDADVLKIYEAALEGLRGVTDSETQKYIISQAHQAGNYKVRILLIDAIKGMNSPEVQEAIAKNMSHSRQEVLLAAVEAAKQKKMTKTVPALIDLVGKLHSQKGLVWVEARRALLAITGQDFENISDWKKWWATVKNNFNPNESDTGSGRGTVIKMSKRTPKLFGTEVVSKRVLFILDISGSMEMKDPETGEGSGGTVVPGQPNPNGGNQANIPESRKRILRAKNELVKVVKALDSDVRFNIIVYSSTLKKWKDQSLYQADPATKADAIHWIESLKANGTTWTDLALKEGFKFQEVNTIYLLSDGSPTHDGQTMLPTGPICEMVKNMNKFRRIRVFTLGFVGANREFMQRLADENNGSYVDIK